MPRRLWPRSNFVPDDWEPLETEIEKFKEKYRVTEEEIKRQAQRMYDCEFRKQRTDWDATFRNWMESEHERGRLKRERTHRRPEELTDAQREEDQRKWEQDMKRLRVVK